MAGNLQSAGTGYLHRLLADAAQPFRYRARVRALLGFPEIGGPAMNFSAPLPSAGFRYFVPRFRAEFDLPEDRPAPTSAVTFWDAPEPRPQPVPATPPSPQAAPVAQPQEVHARAPIDLASTPPPPGTSPAAQTAGRIVREHKITLPKVQAAQKPAVQRSPFKSPAREPNPPAAPLVGAPGAVVNPSHPASPAQQQPAEPSVIPATGPPLPRLVPPAATSTAAPAAAAPPAAAPQPSIPPATELYIPGLSAPHRVAPSAPSIPPPHPQPPARADRTPVQTDKPHLPRPVPVPPVYPAPKVRSAAATMGGRNIA